VRLTRNWVRLHDLGVSNVGYVGKHLTFDDSYLKQKFASQEYKTATDQERVGMAEEAVRQVGRDAHSFFGDQVLAERLKRQNVLAFNPERSRCSSASK